MSVFNKDWALKQKWCSFSKRKTKMYTVGTKNPKSKPNNNVKEIIDYKWNDITLRGRAVVREYAENKLIDWKHFGKDAKDGRYSLSYLQKHYAKMPEIDTADTSDDGSTGSPRSRSPMSMSVSSPEANENITLVIKLAHKLSGAEMWRLSIIKWTAQKSEFIRQKIWAHWFVREICEEYQIDYDDFMGCLNSVFVNVRYPEIVAEHGTDVYRICARKEERGRLDGAVRVLLQCDVKKSRNKSKLYDVMATKKSTQAMHHASIRLIFETRKHWAENIGKYFPSASAIKNKDNNKKQAKSASQIEESRIKISAVLNGINENNNNNNSNIIDLEPKLPASILPSQNVCGDINMNNNNNSQLPPPSQFPPPLQSQLQPLLPTVFKMPAFKPSANIASASQFFTELEHANYPPVQLQQTYNIITQTPNVKQMQGVKQLIDNTVIIHKSGTTGYDLCAKRMSMAKSTYIGVLSMVYLIETSDDVWIDSVALTQSKSQFIKTKLKTTSDAIKKTYSKHVRGYTPTPNKIFK